MSVASLLLFIRTLGLTLPLWIVAGWSAAEAAIFFIVADVPISWIAVRSGTRAALIAAVVAAFASVVGAFAILAWPGGEAEALMASLPAIDPALIERAADGYHRGPAAMLAGSFSGTPFKLYALEAARNGGYGLLLLAPFLRLPRFLGVALFVSGISRLLSDRLDVRRRLALLSLCWAAFYLFYFSVMPA
jgi:hypothetical protein